MDTTVDLQATVDELSFKYEQLVWYARSGLTLKNEHCSAELKEKVLNARSKVEELYPEDIDNYHSAGDFYHGFNSGCLGAFRLMSKAMDEEDFILDEDEVTKWYPDAKQRLEWALEDFPYLET